MIEEVEAEREVVKVYEWRAEVLRRGGFTKHSALYIASSDIDWHYAVRVLTDAKAKGFDEDFVMELLF